MKPVGEHAVGARSPGSPRPRARAVQRRLHRRGRDPVRVDDARLHASTITPIGDGERHDPVDRHADGVREALGQPVDGVRTLLGIREAGGDDDPSGRSRSTSITQAPTSGSATPRVELEHVVRRRGRSTSATRPSGAAALLLDGEADELEDVVRVVLGAPAARRGAPRARSRARPGGRAGSRAGPADALALDHRDARRRRRAAARRRRSAPRSSLASSTTKAPSSPCGRPTRPTGTISLTRQRSRAGTRSRVARGARRGRRVRSARAIRPWRPITLPTSSGATWRREHERAVALARARRAPRPARRRAAARGTRAARRRQPQRMPLTLSSRATALGRLRALAEPVLAPCPRRARSSTARSAGCSGRRSR